jgi:hypothetical protein
MNNEQNISIERLIAIPIEKWELACKKRNIKFKKIEGHINLNGDCVDFIKCALCVEYNYRCIHCRKENLKPDNIKVIGYDMFEEGFFLRFIDKIDKDQMETVKEISLSIKLEDGDESFFSFNRYDSYETDIIVNENGIQCNSPKFWLCILGGFFEWFPLNDFYNNIKNLIAELEGM